MKPFVRSFYFFALAVLASSQVSQAQPEAPTTAKQSGAAAPIRPICAVLLTPIMGVAGDPDPAAFVQNAAAVSGDLNGILNILDSGDKCSPEDVALTAKYLPDASARAKDYIARADVILARADLPRSIEKPLVSFPRMPLILGGASDAKAREIASARVSVLDCQYSLLNLRMSAKNGPNDEATRAEFEKYLADSRAELSKVESAAK
jgi:hypothetical protein